MEKASNKPFSAMRYIILLNMDNEEEYTFYFGSGEVDHATLEIMYCDKYGNNWKALMGGFYTLKRRDLTMKYKNDTLIKELHLFDLSSTFGVNFQLFLEALPFLRKEMEKESIEITHEYF